MEYGETRLTLNNIHSLTTVIVGPNGSGKSQSIKTIKKQLKKDENNAVFYFASKADDAVSRVGSTIDKLTDDLTMYSLGSIFTSEGERINSSFDVFFMSYMLPFLQSDETHKPVWILIDEFDSGLSLDKMKFILSNLFNIAAIEKKRFNRDFHFIFSANGYELVDTIKELRKDTAIFNVEKEQYIEINSYEEFKKIYAERYKTLKQNSQ